jgi:GNAT superfamily N-acetyltransferase
MSADDHLSGLQFSVSHPDELGDMHWARMNDTVVGHAMTIHLPDSPVELAGIRVMDEHQGKGIGHKLLDHVVQHYPDKDITLTPSPFGNEPMNKDQLRTFYGSHGFRPMKNGGMKRRPH